MNVQNTCIRRLVLFITLFTLLSPTISNASARSAAGDKEPVSLTADKERIHYLRAVQGKLAILNSPIVQELEQQQKITLTINQVRKIIENIKVVDIRYRNDVTYQALLRDYTERPELMEVLDIINKQLLEPLQRGSLPGDPEHTLAILFATIAQFSTTSVMNINILLAICLTQTLQSIIHQKKFDINDIFTMYFIYDIKPFEKIISDIGDNKITKAAGSKVLYNSFRESTKKSLEYFQKIDSDICLFCHKPMLQIAINEVTSRRIIEKEASQKDQPQLLRCSKCKIAKYCSKKCQKDHWPVHKPTCKPKPVGESSDNKEQSQTAGGDAPASSDKGDQKATTSATSSDSTETVVIEKVD